MDEIADLLQLASERQSSHGRRRYMTKSSEVTTIRFSKTARGITKQLDDHNHSIHRITDRLDQLTDMIKTLV